MELWVWVLSYLISLLSLLLFYLVYYESKWWFLLQRGEFSLLEESMNLSYIFLRNLVNTFPILPSYSLVSRQCKVGPTTATKFIWAFKKWGYISNPNEIVKERELNKNSVDNVPIVAEGLHLPFLCAEHCSRLNATYQQGLYMSLGKKKCYQRLLQHRTCLISHRPMQLVIICCFVTLDDDDGEDLSDLCTVVVEAVASIVLLEEVSFPSLCFSWRRWRCNRCLTVASHIESRESVCHP